MAVDAQHPRTLPETEFNKLRYSIQFRSSIRPDGTLSVAAAIQPQRAARDAAGKWTDDPSPDARATKVIPDLTAFLTANPDLIQVVNAAWDALDAAVAAINGKLKLV